MANHTNYSLRQVDDSTYADGTWTMLLGYLLSDVLGNFLKELAIGGVLSGWDLQTAKTVTAGSGLVDGTCPKTTVAQAITGLTNGAVNYVYAQADATSHQAERTVDFIASTSSSNPAGTLRLGTITLDAGGTGTAVDNDPTDYRRDRWYGLRMRKTSDSWQGVVAVGGETVVAVDHSDEVTFTGLTEIRVTSADEGVIAWAQPTGAATFNLHIQNRYLAGYDYDYDDGTYNASVVQVDWERIGMA